MGILPAAGRGFEIVAHQGARTLDDPVEMAPSNTLPCFEQAARRGASIELDVMATRDGKLVVYHDDATGRIFSMPGGDKLVRESTYAEIQAAQLNVPGHEADVLSMLEPGAGYRTDARYLNAAIPTLDAVVDALPHTRFYIELKSPDKLRYSDTTNAMEDRVARLIREKNLYDRVTVISFSPASLRKVKEIDPAIRTGLDFKLPARWQRFRPLVEAYVGLYAKRYVGVDSIHMRFQDTTPAMVAAARKRGLGIVPWVAGQSRAEEQHLFPRLIALGVDGLMTNAVDLLQQAVQESGKSRS